MLRSDHAGPARAQARRSQFVLYVEGPRDRDILKMWAHRLSPRLARHVAGHAVILGGRQPARALDHFRDFDRAGRGARGLCVLDRDHGAHAPLESDSDRPGLEFYTWSRRHIESYLLVPSAIRRALRLDPHDSRVDRLFREHVPSAEDEEAMAGVDAKRLLDARGPLARGLGLPLGPGRIARAMQASELHRDVLECLERLRDVAGIPVTQQEFVGRSRRDS
ncbi:MAG: hypothetical protein ACQGVK_14685 [Myxococcota bacterium]